jgi:segregation and condensation protein B
MEDDMTDESKTVETQDAASPSTEENQAAQNQTDVPAEETQQDEQAPLDLPDDTSAPAQETTETIDKEPEPAQEESASVDEKETRSEGTDVVAEETEAPEEAPAAEGPEQPAQEEEQAPTVESVVEAILFAADEPLADSRIAAIVETTTKQIRETVQNLNAKYEANNSAFRIEQIAGGYQMLTLNLYNPWLRKMLRARSDSKLSPAALETLAIIAYKQPIIRADIEAVRGVAVGEVIRSLMYKGLVKIVGRAEILGRPMLYGTTKKFLEVFGLNSLKDLPKVEELKNPDR